MPEMKTWTADGTTYEIRDAKALPKAGGEMTGWIDFGNADRGLSWTMNDGTTITIRPYVSGNVLQIVRKPVDDTAKNCFLVKSDGTIATDVPIPLTSGGTGVTTLAALKSLLGITQRLYMVTGEILSSKEGGTTRGVGRATVHITPDRVARVDYAVKITKAGSVAGIYGVGIDAALLSSINANIPTITPKAGGVCTYYNTDGTVHTIKQGHGGTHTAHSTAWALGRIYNDNGAYGSWSDSNFESSVGTLITGTCYGTVAS